jgi:hypothetical protein
MTNVSKPHQLGAGGIFVHFFKAKMMAGLLLKRISAPARK